MEFQVFHKYAKLVRRNLAPALVCSHCQNPYTLMLGAFDEPVLKCFTCNITTVPGYALYNQIRAIVKEHFA